MASGSSNRQRSNGHAGDEDAALDLLLDDNDEIQAELQKEASPEKSHAAHEHDSRIPTNGLRARSRSSSSHSSRRPPSTVRGPTDALLDEDSSNNPRTHEPLDDSHLISADQDTLPASPLHSRSSTPDGPDQELCDFDWADLTRRFHAHMDELDANEKNIYQEFNNMIHVFAVWAGAGSRRETERDSKRLKTQMAYVQAEERDLENKRQHYIKVVEAFKMALQLLEN